MRKKALLSRGLALSGTTTLLMRLRQAMLSEVRVLTYHRVIDAPSAQDYPFDLELISASVEEFAWQMGYIRRYWNPLPLSELVEIVQKGRRPPKKTVLVTFDDGFEDNYTNAFPILSAYRIPATLFVTTGYIGKSKVFWYEEVTFVVNMRKGKAIVIPEVGADTMVPIDLERRQHLQFKLLARMKQVPDVVRVEALKGLRSRYANIVDGLKEWGGNSRLMGWEQIKAMARKGIEVGSHTVTHPILTKLDDSKLMAELVESKNKIEYELGTDVYALAYPNGSRDDFDRRVEKAAEDAGYSVAFSFVDGINRWARIPRYAINRLHISPINDRHVFAAKLALPEII